MITIGLSIAAIGALIWGLSYTPIRLGRLPGDLLIRKGGFSLYFPVATCLLLSALASLAMWAIRLLRR